MVGGIGLSGRKAEGSEHHGDPLAGVVNLDCRLAGGSWQAYRMEVINLGRH